MTSDELVQVLKAGLPRDVVRARLVEGADGQEFLLALADLFALVSDRANVDGLGSAYFLTAERGAHATCTVDLTVTTVSGKTLLAGARFRAPDGRAYVSMADQPYGPGTNTHTIAVAGEWAGAGYDVAAGEIQEYVSGDWILSSTGAATTAPTIDAVSASTEAANGRFATLDMLARNRGVYAGEAEPTETLRRRAWERPWAATPADIVRLATLVFWESQPTATAPYQEVVLYEPMDASPAYDEESAYDDAVAGGPEAWYVPGAGAWFAVFLPEIEELTVLGAYDEGVAYDDFNDPAFDEWDAERAAIWSAVMAAVEAARAAGVKAFFYIGDPPSL